MRETTYRVHLAVGVLSGAAIAFELVLMHLLATVQWYHFAYMVLSVALLGFGAAGTALALARDWLLRRFDALLPLLMMASGVAMAAGVALSQTPPARFDAYLLLVEPAQIRGLVLSYLLFLIPFFLGALAIGLVFVREVEQIGRFYFANLFGSGAGGLAALGLLWIARPERLPAVTALMAVAAGLLVLPRRARGRLLLAAAAALALSLFFLLRPPHLARSPYKSLSYTLNLPGAEIVLTRSSPYGLVQVVAAPALRYAPGLSLAYTGDVPVQQALFNNGDWLGPVTAWARGDTTHLLDYTTTALPYTMRARRAVLVLNAGAGDYVAQAVAHGARRVVAIEPDETVLALLRDDLVGPTDSLFYHPAVTARPVEPRTYLAADTARYDVITLPAAGAFGGVVGLAALHEHYTLTREGVRAMWDRLTPHGAVSITVWMDYPYRHALKILATLAEVLEDAGVDDPAAYVAAVRSWGAVTFTLQRAPLTPEEIRNIRLFCDRMAFDPLLLPGLAPGERARFNQMQDDRFFAYVDQLLSPERDALYDSYDFAIRPATDNRPYFGRFLRWRSLPRLTEQFGNRAASFLEIGYLIACVTMLQLFLAALVLIILPLFRLGWRGRGKGWTLVYFGGLGLGYLFVEIVLIQRFTLYLGHPLYAATAVITTLLMCSGIGSYVSERLPARRATLARVAGGVACFILFYAVVLTPLLKAGIALPLSLKAVGAFLLIAPPAFVMGMPFPLGLRFLAARSERQVPWAWGINGCLSVVSTALATVLAVEGGFVLVMLLAAAAYALVAAVNLVRG